MQQPRDIFDQIEAYLADDVSHEELFAWLLIRLMITVKLLRVNPRSMCGHVLSICYASTR